MHISNVCLTRGRKIASISVPISLPIVSTIRYLHICDHNKDGYNNEHKQFYLCSDWQFAISLPEKLFSNLFVYMAVLTYLTGPFQMLFPLLIFSDFLWFPLSQWFSGFPSLDEHHRDLG